MKILIYTDLHMCPRASIISKWGTTYPVRLENCVKSVNWAEELAEKLGCAQIVNLGDFFDKPELSSETITALTEINWSSLVHTHLVGNHEASVSSLDMNSINVLASDKHRIISEPVKNILDAEVEICFLPYVTESNRRSLVEYFGEKTKPRIILSHNDLAGIQMGPIVSQTGFSVDEIEANCDLFINGHLHNGQQISNKIINLGNLSGKDFGEDANRYTHNIMILDTDTLSYEFIENPFAFNFYKIQVETTGDLMQLHQLKPNAICSIKCDSELLAEVKKELGELSNSILESRIIITKKYKESTEETMDIDLSVDHLARFIECCKANIENTTILDEEIAEVCK